MMFGQSPERLFAQTRPLGFGTMCMAEWAPTLMLMDAGRVEQEECFFRQAAVWLSSSLDNLRSELTQIAMQTTRQVLQYT